MGLSPSSQQQTLPWDCSTIPMLQLPAAVLSSRLVFLSRVSLALAGVVCVILIPFRLSQISCFTHSLKCFSFVLTIAPMWESNPCFSFPPIKGRTHPADSPFYPLLLPSYQVLHDSMYSFPLVRYSCLLPAGVLQSLCIWKCILDVSVEIDVLHVTLPEISTFNDFFFNLGCHQNLKGIF